MSKVLNNGQEIFDGQVVGQYEGRIVGPFLMEPEDGVALANGDQITLLVTVRVEAPKFSNNKKTGVLKRSNNMRVEAAVPLDRERARFLLDSMGVAVEGVNEGFDEEPEEPVDVEGVEAAAEEEIHDGWSEPTLWSTTPDVDADDAGLKVFS